MRQDAMGLYVMLLCGRKIAMPRRSGAMPIYCGAMSTSAVTAQSRNKWGQMPFPKLSLCAA
jgi:hypothetical protein